MTRAQACEQANKHIAWMLLHNPAALLQQLRELIVAWLMSRRSQ